MVNFNAMVLLLIVPLFFSLKSAFQFGQNWLYLIPNSPDLWEITKMAKTDSTQWVSVMEGEHFWNIAAFDSGLKLSNVYSAQEWKDRDIPPACMEITPEVIAPENRRPGVFNPGNKCVAPPECGLCLYSRRGIQNRMPGTVDWWKY